MVRGQRFLPTTDGVTFRKFEAFLFRGYLSSYALYASVGYAKLLARPNKPTRNAYRYHGDPFVFFKVGVWQLQKANVLLFHSMWYGVPYAFCEAVSECVRAVIVPCVSCNAYGLKMVFTPIPPRSCEHTVKEENCEFRGLPDVRMQDWSFPVID